VWFTNLATNLNISWGTPDPIQLQDPKYQVMVPIRAFGQYGIKINNSKKFLLKIVGTLTEFDSDAISEYLRGALITKIKTCIANAIIQNGVSVLEINMHLDSLSELIKQSLTKNFSDFGIELTQFNIHSINIPEDDPALITLKNALSKKAEMGIDDVILENRSYELEISPSGLKDAEQLDIFSVGPSANAVSGKIFPRE
jgi:membrane protease subunit (stomatin/prohibitin family)